MFLNYQIKHGGITVNEDGLYVPSVHKFREAVTSLAIELLTIEGEGDYARAHKFSGIYGEMTQQTRATLDRIEAAGIPIDIHTVFRM